MIKPLALNRSRRQQYWALGLLFALASPTALADQPTTQGKAGAIEAKPKRVTVIPVEQRLIPKGQSTSALAISLQQGPISAQLAALVSNVHKDVGETVKQGEVLVSLDCRDARLSLDAAKATLDQARREQKRAESLNRKQSLSEQALNQAETGLIQARAQYRTAQLQVERCEVKAPYPATVTAREVSAGTLASPGMPLVTLVNTSRVELSSQLLPAQARAIHSAQSLDFRAQGQVYPVVLRSLIPVVDPTKGTQEARLSFTSTKPSAGLNGRLHWSMPGKFLPSRYLVTRKNQPGIFITTRSDTGQLARFVALPAAEPGNPVAVDMPAGSLLIEEGRFSLEDGDKIATEDADS
ncbi:MAG: efflux RND transporter periplasmic adaptor subunit [bacterium]